MNEEILAGGVANAGAVTRVGGYVLRPANPYSGSIHQFLSALRHQGFGGASMPVGIDSDGRERLEYIAGEVAVPPYPEWAQSDGALSSGASLVRRLHDAARGFDPTGLAWSPEIADPEGGPIVCHNDVCLENVVFRDGVAVGLLDFDFAAPGRPLWDLAAFASMCVPVDCDANAALLGWVAADRPARTRLVADSYGLSAGERQELLAILDGFVARSGQWVQSKVEAGDPNFIKMWNELGGRERYDRRRQWWADERERFVSALDL